LKILFNKKKKDIKKIKIKEVSQKGDKQEEQKDVIQQENSSIDPMRQSQKMSLINAFNAISSDHKGNTETIVMLYPSFPK
jgi:hypothetical protein